MLQNITAIEYPSRGKINYALNNNITFHRNNIAVKMINEKIISMNIKYMPSKLIHKNNVLK